MLRSGTIENRPDNRAGWTPWRILCLWLGRLDQILALRRSRIALERLEPHLLDDIGLTPDDVRAELRRSAFDRKGFEQPNERP